MTAFVDQSSSLTLEALHRRLLHAYGPQEWWPAESPFEVMVGAVLTQNAAWTNVEKAIQNLKRARALSPPVLRQAPLEKLAELVRPAGCHNMKAKKLRALAVYLAAFDDDLDRLFASRPLPDLRRDLLGVYGIGRETADAILLYAGGLPVFVIDAYTQRLLTRLGLLAGPLRYDVLQERFHATLPREKELFNQFHALIVTHGKTRCRGAKPLCGGCPLLDACPAGQTALLQKSDFKPSGCGA